VISGDVDTLQTMLRADLSLMHARLDPPPSLHACGPRGAAKAA